MDTVQFQFPDTVPLMYWDDGSIRVHGSRVTLDTIVARFQQGCSPLRIHYGFPTLTVAQINAVIDWYLNHQTKAGEYIKKRDAEAERERIEYQSRPEYKAFREILD